MRISDWSSDVCSSDLILDMHRSVGAAVETPDREGRGTVAMDAFGQACDAADRNEIDVGNNNAEAAREQHRSIFIIGGVRNASTEERRVGQECISTCRSRGRP